MRMTSKHRIAAAVLASTLIGTSLVGCGASESGTDAGTGSDADATAAAGSAQDATGSSEATGSSDATGSTGSTGAESTSGVTVETQEAPSFDFSQNLDENGHWEGVKALDYVKLCDYSAIKIPADEVTPTDDDVQAQIDTLASSYTETQHVTSRAVKDGDTVNIDYVGSIDGKEFDGGSTEGNGTTVTIGTTSYLDDFLEQLIGHKPGETFDVEVTFPEDYGVDSLNGKDAVFSVTINYISEKVEPEIDDEWVAANLQEAHGWTTVDEMKASIKKDLLSQAVSNYVQEYVAGNSTVSEIPSKITEYQENLLIYQYQAYANMFDMELSDMLSMAAGVETTDELIEANRESLDTIAKYYLVFQAITEQEGFTATDKEAEEFYTTNTGNDASQIEEGYGMPYMKLCVLIDKVADLLTANATVEE